MTQVPAERRIKVADTLRLLFHYFNVVNLTLGLIVFGVGGSLILHPLPLGGINEVGKPLKLLYILHYQQSSTITDIPPPFFGKLNHEFCKDITLVAA